MNVGAADAQRVRATARNVHVTGGTALEGYNNDFENRGQYRQVFRDAFEQGYRDGFQRLRITGVGGDGN